MEERNLGNIPRERMGTWKSAALMFNILPSTICIIHAKIAKIALYPKDLDNDTGNITQRSYRVEHIPPMLAQTCNQSVRGLRDQASDPIFLGRQSLAHLVRKCIQQPSQNFLCTLIIRGHVELDTRRLVHRNGA